MPVIVIFGPIASGKSSLLEALSKKYPRAICDKEPVNILTQTSLLQDLYAGVAGAALRLQTVVALQRVTAYYTLAANYSQGMFILDGHLLTDADIFVKYGHKVSGKMDKGECEEYFDLVHQLSSLREMLIPTLYIYLQCSAITCYERSQLRSRDQERGLSVDFFFQHVSACNNVISEYKKHRLPMAYIDAEQKMSKVIRKACAHIIAAHSITTVLS